MPEHNQFAVWASDSLSHAELEITVEHIATFSNPYASSWEQIELTVGMHRITRVIANSYGECLMKLFSTWQPTQDRKPDGITQATYVLPTKPKEING